MHTTIEGPRRTDTTWRQTACILCECNCGVEVQVEERSLARIRGDKAHPASQGYTCNKAMRLDHYQNGRDRLTSPLRRRADGTFEAVGWETAIAEIAGRLSAARDAHGGESIFFYGGGGQGNHLGGVHLRALMHAVGARYYSNALAQEKTGEGWVDSHLYGGHTKGDFERSEVVLFLGKNPWQSQSFPRARVVLKEIAKDPRRAMIVVDPRRTETAELADFHLQVRPGTDAWCMSAMLGVLLEEDLVDHAFLARHTTGAAVVLEALAAIDVADCAGRCGVDERLIRAATRRFAAAASAATYEDLGVQQAPNSTLVSYLNKLLWILTGNFARPGGMHIHSWLVPLAGQWQVSRARERTRSFPVRRRLGRAAMRVGAGPLFAALPRLSQAKLTAGPVSRLSSAALRVFFEAVGPEIAAQTADKLMMSEDRGRLPEHPSPTPDFPNRTPVTGAPIVGGLIPANAIADEILTDHPDRLRAIWIESSNPAHSLPESPRFKRALDALELVVVVDVAMTETARCADYVLPAASQFEKWESTLFNVEFPENMHHLRAPLLDPAPGTRTEPEIHADVIRALGVVDERLIDALRTVAAADRPTFTLLFFSLMAARSELQGLAPYLAHETLGRTLAEGSAATALVWAMSMLASISQPEAVARAGFDRPLHERGDQLFEALLRERSGVVFTRDDYADAWNYVRHPDRRIHLEIPALLTELRLLPDAPAQWTDDEYPFVLAAGERRDYTANAIFRDPTWRKRDADGALRISPHDAEALGIGDGNRVRIITRTGQAETGVEITDTLQPGHITLPNGMGLDSRGDHGLERTGVALNELTSAQLRDPFLGTPWHKHVPARLEPVA